MKKFLDENNNELFTEEYLKKFSRLESENKPIDKKKVIEELSQIFELKEEDKNNLLAEFYLEQLQKENLSQT